DMRLAYSMIALAVLAGAGCTDEKIVFRDRPAFNPPPDSVNGFLGYFTVSTKQTTCGNCHVGVQNQWASTKHSQAWADLQGSGHASGACTKCHTVSELGNNIGHPAGYSTVADSAYHDVQCESCHGPGFTHVENPDIAANQPLARMHVDTGVTNSCSGCHTGVHTPFVEQWKESAHGSGPGFAAAATNTSCQPCHEGRVAMQVKFGENANFVEKASATPERIGCVTCHNPHGSPNTAQLRAPLETPTRDQLCVTCHSRTGVPPWPTVTGTSTARGPHGAQGLLVLGENIGWIPPGFAYDTSQMASSHGTGANPRLCATCHVVRTTVTDKLTGAFSFQSVGHTFDAIPCTDTAGVPKPCADVPDTTAPGAGGHNFVACSSSGCHVGGPGVAKLAYQTLKGELDNYLDQIWTDVNGNGIIDSAGVDQGLVPQLVSRALRSGATAADSAPINFRNNVTSVAKGTLWNAALAATEERAVFTSGKLLGNGFAAHRSAGNGVHNPFLLKALLIASIASMHSTYGLSSPVPSPSAQVPGPLPPGVRLRSTQ
ncbi:MAG TPA: cytochrome c3 family protein, partial [Vicinamibacterales bacterium]|nr:cytochrome c3 family protein [Vicinamibacterales bacterium]